MQKKTLTVSVFVFLIALALLIAGCATRGLVGKLPSVEQNQYAEVMIIRADSLRGASTVTVSVDGNPLFGITKGDHTVFKMPAGDHSVGIDGSSVYDTARTFEPGKKYYYLIKVSYYHYVAYPVERAEAKLWLKKSNKYMSVDDTIVYKDLLKDKN